MKPVILRFFLLILLIFMLPHRSTGQFAHIKRQPSDFEIEHYKYEARHRVKKINSKDQKFHPVKNIILMIGDGMGAAQVTAGLVANKGRLYVEQFPVTGFIKTSSANSLITDSGAAATALATGKKTDNGMIAQDPQNRRLKTIVEYAEEHGLATGIVVTSTITHATPAAFAAHAYSREYYSQIALDLARSGIDVLIGGGRNDFTDRPDKVNLIDAFTSKNYVVVDTLDRLEAATGDKLAGLLYANSPPGIMEGRGDMLSRATLKAMDILDRNEKGYFLMIEGSQIDWGNHRNNILFQTEETLDFDRVIGAVLGRAMQDGETLVIVTADHETGGLAIREGNMRKGIVYADYTTTHHTGVMVPVYAFGPGSENFVGIYDNTEIFYKMIEAFGWKAK